MLAELYITFEVLAAVFLIKGIDGIERQFSVYGAISAIIFFSLALLGSEIESLFTGSTVSVVEAMAINVMLGAVSALVFIASIFGLVEKSVRR